MVKVVCMEQLLSLRRANLPHHRNGSGMNTIPIQNVWFDDAATSAMGEAFDEACKSLQDFGSAPEIIANLIIAGAKDGERDFVRLYKRALRAFGADYTSTRFVSIGSDRPVPAYALVTHAA